MLTAKVNPFSSEIRYTLGMMAYHLSLARPSSVRIASQSSELVKSVIRYLCYEPSSILVETRAIQTDVAHSLGIMVGVVSDDTIVADTAMFPFSLEEGMQPAGEQTIIAACYNAISYKSLLYPLSKKETIFRQLAGLRPGYQIRPTASLYSPRFILWQALAKLVEHWNSALYFQLEDRAMRQFIESGPLWRLSYIVILTGRRAS